VLPSRRAKRPPELDQSDRTPPLSQSSASPKNRGGGRKGFARHFERREAIRGFPDHLDRNRRRNAPPLQKTKQADEVEYPLPWKQPPPDRILEEIAFRLAGIAHLDEADHLRRDGFEIVVTPSTRLKCHVSSTRPELGWPASVAIAAAWAILEAFDQGIASISRSSPSAAAS
jgi:hypothetical protein